MPEIVEGGIFNLFPNRDKFEAGSPLGRFEAQLEREGQRSEYGAEYLNEQLGGDFDLAEMALIIAGQNYPGLSENYYLEQLDRWAADLGLLLSAETDPYRTIGIINTYLFDTLGFKGNEKEYADPRNSYLNDVIERRTGIPITLSLVYLELGKRLGLPLQGIGLPGHFILRYSEPASQTFGRLSSPYERSEQGRPDSILFDPFNGGTILSEEDCTRIVSEVYQRPVALPAIVMRPVSSRQFLTRLLNNLKATYFAEEDFTRGLAIEEFLVLLNPRDWEQYRDRAALRYRNGQRWKAVTDFETYLEKRPEARDADSIRQYERKILQEIAERN